MKKLTYVLSACLFLMTFAELFAQLPPGQQPGGLGWADSYNANGLCWCRTTFDHDLDNINKVSFVINGTKRNIRDICNELEKHPQRRSYRKGDPIYNDVQCGNGPANTAIDETQCPGRVDKGRNGCSEKGPRWDIAWLRNRPRFGGGGGNPNPPAPTANKKPSVRFAKPGNNSSFAVNANISVDVTASDSDGSVSNVRLYLNNQFVRQENVAPYLWGDGNKDGNFLKNIKAGTYVLRAVAKDNDGATAEARITITVGNNPTPAPAPTVGGAPINQVIALRKSGGNRKYVTAERNRNDGEVLARASNLGPWEQFRVESHPQGGIALKAISNGKYLQTRNTATNRPLAARGEFKGSYEQFEWNAKGGNAVAIKSLRNGKYISANHGTNNALVFPSGNSDGAFETFNFEVVAGAKAIDNTASSAQIFVPSPISIQAADALSMEIDLKEAANTSISVISLSGQIVAQENYGTLDAGTTIVDIENIRQAFQATGLYVLSIRTGNEVMNRMIAVTE